MVDLKETLPQEAESSLFTCLSEVKRDLISRYIIPVLF